MTARNWTMWTRIYFKSSKIVINEVNEWCNDFDNLFWSNFLFVPGRVHSAVVSGINVDTNSVTVEWFEKGETKGKEVCIEEEMLNFRVDLKLFSFNYHVKVVVY